MFENDFLAFMRDHHSDILETIAKGIINDEVTGVIEKAAADVAMRYSQR
jgi:hypothetical protein